jgi:hypothetical protein
MNCDELNEVTTLPMPRVLNTPIDHGMPDRTARELAWFA